MILRTLGTNVVLSDHQQALLRRIGATNGVFYFPGHQLRTRDVLLRLQLIRKKRGYEGVYETTRAGKEWLRRHPLPTPSNPRPPSYLRA